LLSVLGVFCLTSSVAMAETALPERLQQCRNNSECVVMSDACGQPVAIAMAWATDYLGWLRVERTAGERDCKEVVAPAASGQVARCEKNRCRLQERSRRIR
jgi:hypothetical protein